VALAEDPMPTRPAAGDREQRRSRRRDGARSARAADRRGTDRHRADTPGNVDSGHLAFKGIGLASGCAVPSKGTRAVTVAGTFAGAPVADAITICSTRRPSAA